MSLPHLKVSDVASFAAQEQTTEEGLGAELGLPEG